MRFCPVCEKKAVSVVQGDEPWTTDHLQCSECDSTFADDRDYNNQRARKCRATGRWKPVAQQYRGTGPMRKSRYGITEEQYEKMLADTPDCPICKEEITIPHVDHDHVTGRVRSILCHKCNTLLGIVENRRHLLDTMLQYLDDHGAVAEAGD